MLALRALANSFVSRKGQLLLIGRRQEVRWVPLGVSISEIVILKGPRTGAKNPRVKRNQGLEQER
jgi:hypothetical protein